MRARCFVVGSLGLAMLLVAAACTSFGADDASAAEAGPETSQGDARAAACAIPTPAPPITTCSDCAATPLFTTEKAQLAIVAGTTIYSVRAGELRANPNIETGTFTHLDEGPAINGDPTAMAVDDAYVYVSTTKGHVRVPRAGGVVAPLPLFHPDPSVARPVLVGTTFFYELQPERVVRSPKAGDPDAGTEVTVTPTSALAVDGDVAYWIGTSSASEQVIQGPFPDLTGHGTVSSKVLGFVVKDQLAYVAEPSTTGIGSVISRIDLGDSARARLTDEPGKVESFHVSGHRLYWIALRLPADGSRVFASVDLCGGPTTLHAKELMPLRSTVSFDASYAYAAGAAAEAIYRMKK
ncbi:MAG TPA: hypothetical protein VLT33_13060 [Labilithrix sp.]|nr:hypothetical protein [Labilithrix sp.]